VSAAPRAAAWKRRVLYALCAVGFGVSGYLTAAHFAGNVSLACPTTGVINCERVTTSPQSNLGPLPVPVLGLVWFGVLAAFIAIPGRGPVRPIRIVWALGGLAFVCYLVYAELFLVGSICLWCSAVHLVAFTLCLLVISGLDEPDAETMPMNAHEEREHVG
jgi:uncharacterized membrane protein